MIDWKEIRKQFPALGKYTYLNVAGGSPLSLSAANAGKSYFEEMLSEGDAPYERWLLRVEETRRKLAKLIHARPEEIGFTVNTSTGMNIIASMINDPCELLTMRDEFPSSTVPWINKSYPVRFVEPSKNVYPVELIEKNIGSETKILLSSYVQYCTGFRQDLKALGDLCRKHNLIFIVNATQALGVMPVNVMEYGIDFMAFSGLKWMTSGYGCGGVYISRKMLERYKIPFAGWQSTRDPDKMDNANFSIRREASAIEAGCPDFPAVFSLGGALDLVHSVGPPAISRRVLELNRILQKELENAGLPLIKPLKEKYRSGIMIVKTGNAKTIVEKLAEKNILVSARGEGIRISLSFFNNEDDIKIFIREISEIKDLL